MRKDSPHCVSQRVNHEDRRENIGDGRRTDFVNKTEKKLEREKQTVSEMIWLSELLGWYYRYYRQHLSTLLRHTALREVPIGLTTGLRERSYTRSIWILL